MNIHPSIVVVALSGGLDSSFAALRLLELGWQVRGLHLVLPGPSDVIEARRRAALEVARILGIEIDFLDVTHRFADLVVSPFVDGYLGGLTPNPCVACNERIKFPALCNYADTMDIPFVATGHYARLEGAGKDLKLIRGCDRLKDQSYFLHRVPARHLRRTIFPIGELTKEHCRNEAVSNGLASPGIGESQEICFLADADYRTLVECNAEGKIPAAHGRFVTESGRVLGEHRGVHRFTVGQRRGMGIASKRPYYVKALRPESGEVVVGRKEEIFSRDVHASEFRWMLRPTQYAELLAQIRHRHRAAPGIIRMQGEDTVLFTFNEPQWAVTPGQALVCYDGDVMVGGGWISSR
jgi:tRNA-uridine 2-sulfurtransferase